MFVELFAKKYELKKPNYSDVNFLKIELSIANVSGKCELYHWIDILDLCDDILEQVR